MTQLVGACWGITDDDGTGGSGDLGNAAWVDAVEASINDLIHSTTNPAISPADLIDEVVEARGTFDTLNDRLGAVVDIDGALVGSTGGGLTQTFRGLHLRTSPGAATALHQVELIRAREIVYNDGRTSGDDFVGLASGVLPLVADIAVSGVGGLDTGAEAASTWYEIYAIRNDVTGVHALLLHKAPYYFTDQNQSIEDGSHTLRRATGPVNTKLAQGFKVDNAAPLEIVDVKLIRAGAIANNIWFTIEADVAGAPSGVALATSQVIAAADVATVAQQIRVTFRNPASLAAATQYHLVLQGDYAASDAVNISWRADTTAAVYGNGSKSSYDGATWTADPDDDFFFYIITTRDDTALVLPTGYTQYCLIGYVYNGSGSDFLQFVAFDRNVTNLDQKSIAAGTVSATPLLTSLTTLIPPILVALNPVVSCGTNAGDVCVGIVPDGIVQTADQHRHKGAVRFKNPAGDNTVKVELAPILTQYQSCYLSSAAAVSFDCWLGAWEWF